MNFDDALSNPATHEVTFNLLRSLSMRADELDERGVTPLHMVGAEHVHLFVENGADPNARDWNGETPLHNAVVGRQNNADRAHELLKHGADAQAMVTKGRGVLSPLHMAWSDAVAKVLLDYGAEVNARDGDGRTPLHNACSAAMAKVLLDHGADVNARDGNGRTPLHKAMAWSDGAAKVLLDHGADVNARDGDGRTPLHEARLDTVAKLLLDHGADPNARDSNGNTPLHHMTALDWHDESMIKMMIDHGADVNVRDNEGRTLLHEARMLSNVRLLLALGADINAQDDDGNTPLFHDMQDHQGLAPLLNVFNDVSHQEPVLSPKGQILMKSGADPFLANHAGQTPHDFAMAAGDLGAVAVFGAARREREALATPPERSRSRERGRS